jgi:hypothetical protein
MDREKITEIKNTSNNKKNNKIEKGSCPCHDVIHKLYPRATTIG